MKISKKIIATTVVVILVLGLGYSARKFFRKPLKNVILIMLDTTRADHLSPYGYERDTTPALTQFATESLFFNRAVTSAPWTPPAIAGMFTGRNASSHGLMPPNSAHQAKENATKLSSDLVTLAELLKEKGYRTVGITPNPWTTKEFGFDQGFDIYSLRERAGAREITRTGMKVLTGLEEATQPTFLFLHYLDPHNPYAPPAPYDTMYQGSLKEREYTGDGLTFLNLYDGELSSLDHYLGIFFQFLKNHNLYESSLIIIVADHGEQFFERGDIGHGHKLFDEELRVPLMVRLPGRAPERIDYTVSNLDVFSTILDYAGIKPQSAYQSISLFDEKALLQRPGIISEIIRKVNWKSFTSLEGKKLIMDYGSLDNKYPTDPPSIVGVFDPIHDPFEKSALQDEKLLKGLQAQYDAQFQALLKDRVDAQSVSVKDDTIDKLRSLGYLK